MNDTCTDLPRCLFPGLPTIHAPIQQIGGCWGWSLSLPLLLSYMNNTCTDLPRCLFPGLQARPYLSWQTRPIVRKAGTRACSSHLTRTGASKSASRTLAGTACHTGPVRILALGHRLDAKDIGDNSYFLALGKPKNGNKSHPYSSPTDATIRWTRI